ncbi:phosphotransferase [Glutamicibacter endophyticus]
MKRSAMELAAIATAAVPGLAPVGYAALSDDAEDFDSALIIDDQQNRWRVRSPRHDEASMRLESELSALRAFSARVRAALPFALPQVAGSVRQGPLRTFVYKDMPGKTTSLEELVDAGKPLAAALGRAMAAIHQIPDDAVEVAGLPCYTSDEVRQRKLNELDTAAATGLIPSRLLRRWEHAMEDVSLWRFNAAVVHGDFYEEQIQVLGGAITAVKGWTDLHVGDPADDFAWLSAVGNQGFSELVFSAYIEARGDKADPHIMRRAALAAEFALAQWLVKSLATKDQQRIDEAQEMLCELDTNIADYGGQPLSVVEPPRPLQSQTEDTKEPAATEDSDRTSTKVSRLPDESGSEAAPTDSASSDRPGAETQQPAPQPAPQPATSTVPAPAEEAKSEPAPAKDSTQGS